MKSSAEKRPLLNEFSIGDRVLNIRPDRFGKPNSLGAAEIIDTHGTKYAVIRYDTDPIDDPGFPEPFENLRKI